MEEEEEEDDEEEEEEDDEVVEEEEEEEDEEDEEEDLDGLLCTSKCNKKAGNYALSLSLQSGRYPEFKCIEGPSPIVDLSMSPLELVRFLWPNTLCELIAQETNWYAIVDRKLKNWSDVTTEELWAFLGITVIMGIHRLPEIDNYWSSDRFLVVEAIQKCMSRNRFWSI